VLTKAVTISGIQKNHALFSVLTAASVGFWWHPITATTKLALSSDAHTHILLILPLTLALIYLEREPAGAVHSFGRGTGVALVIAAVLLRSMTTWNQIYLSASLRLSVNMLGLVLWWVGSGIFCFGLKILRSHAFAFCFLLLVVPWPNAAVTWVISALQQGSAIATEALFRLAQVPVMRHDVVLSIPGLDIEIANECSSIRSSTILIVVTLLFAHLFLRSKWRKIVLVIAAIPLSIAKNAVRIFTIAELGTRVDPGYLSGRLHHDGGVIFLALAIAIIIMLLWVLREYEPQATPLSAKV
jgi:exosortase